MPDRAAGIIDGLFGGMANFVLTIIAGVSGTTMQVDISVVLGFYNFIASIAGDKATLDIVEQIGRIVSELTFITSTLIIIIINFKKFFHSIEEGVDALKNKNKKE